MTCFLLSLSGYNCNLMAQLLYKVCLAVNENTKFDNILLSWKSVPFVILLVIIIFIYDWNQRVVTASYCT